jgi:hypothetical protein
MAAPMLASLTASPAVAQREPTDGALTYATAAYRAREPVSKVAPELRSKYRQSGEALARTLLSAGYAAPDVAAHLVSTDREPAGATVAWLAASGVDARRAWDAVSRATREPPEKVAAETMERIGPVTAPIMVTWGRTFQTAGLSAEQVEGIYRQVGSTDPKQTAQALKDSGYTATEIAEALNDMDADQLIAIFLEINFGGADIAKAAKDALGLTFSQTLQALAAVDDGPALVARAAAAASEFGATADEAAEALNLIGVVTTITITIIAVIMVPATLGAGLVTLNVSQLLMVVAMLIEHGTPPGQIGEAMSHAQVDIEKAAAAMAEFVPLEDAYETIEDAYGAGAQGTADAFTAAGESLTAVMQVVFDVSGSFQTTVDIVPSDRVNSPDVMAVIFEVFAASAEQSNRDKVFWLMKAGMTADNVAKGLRDVIGLDAAAIAQLFVDAGVTSPSAIANALSSSGFTQPLVVAHALKDAGFSLDQVQAALMAAFTLSMQQLAQILSAVFGG